LGRERPSQQPSAPVTASTCVLELLDVELTTLPLMVFFRIGVRAARNGEQHHVNKRYSDLADFHHALERELVSAWLLPQFPAQLPEKELSTPGFRAQMQAYLARLGRCPEALDTYSFKNFFQMSDEYQRWAPSMDGLLLKQRPRSPQSPAADEARASPGNLLLMSQPGHVGGRKDSAAAQSQSGYFTSVPRRYSASGASGEPAPAPVVRAQGPTPTPLPEASLATPSLPSSEGELLLLHGSRGQAHQHLEQHDRRSLPTSLSPAQRAEIQAQVEEVRSQQQRRSPPAASPATADVGPPAPAVAAAGASPWIWAPDSAAGAATAAPAGNAPVAPRAGDSARSKALPAQARSASSEDVASISGGRSGKTRRRPWCVICMAKRQEVAIDPCGHMSMCHGCAGSVQACPICRGPIDKMLRVYMA